MIWRNLKIMIYFLDFPSISLRPDVHILIPQIKIRIRKIRNWYNWHDLGALTHLIFVKIIVKKRKWRDIIQFDTAAQRVLMLWFMFIFMLIFKWKYLQVGLFSQPFPTNYRKPSKYQGLGLQPYSPIYMHRGRTSSSWSQCLSIPPLPNISLWWVVWQRSINLWHPIRWTICQYWHVAWSF